MMKSCLRMSVVALLALLAQLASAQIYVEVVKRADNPTPIAIVPFLWQGFGVLPENITDVVKSDLGNSGLFAPLDEKNMLSTPHEESEVHYRDWTILGSDYIVVGKINRANGSSLIEVQYELFDVARQTRMVGEVISGTEAQLRDISHQISDVVFEKITGVRGAFATKILYVTSQRISDKVTNYQLNLADADGGRPQVLLDRQEPILSPTWSPDAKQIAYVSFETTRPRIYIQNLATGAREMITNFPGNNSGPAWSPDGTKLAMVLSKDGSFDIYVMDLRSRELKRVTNHFAAETEPSWTPDGKSIIYTSDQGGNNRPQIYQVNLETGFNERVTYDGIYNSKASLLQDGKNMIVIHRYDTSDDFHLAVMNLDRGTIRAITSTQLDESPTVSPNASMVMYASKKGGRGILNAVSIDGRVQYQLPVSKGDVYEPAWSPFLD